MLQTKVNINTKLLRHFGPQKEKLSLGVTSIQLLPSEDLLVGTGDGTIAVMRGAPSFKLLKSAKVVGEVTSVVLRGSGNQVRTGHYHIGWSSPISLCYSSSLEQMLHNCISQHSKTLIPL